MKYISYVLLIIILPVTLWLVHEPVKQGSIYFLPFDLSAVGTPGDVSGSITLNWLKIPGDNGKEMPLAQYTVFRAQNQNGPFAPIATISFGDQGALPNIRQFRDTTAVIGQTYFYKLSADPKISLTESDIVGPIISVSQQPFEGAQGVGEILFPPTQLQAFDSPNDDGHSITLEWKISPNDAPKSAKFNGYDIYRAAKPEGPFAIIGDATGGESDSERHVKIFADGNNVSDDSTYYYYVQAKGDGQVSRSNISGPARSSQQFFHTGRAVSLALLGLLVAVILFYINQAKAGRDLYIRKIAGLEAVDEAVGRATEMGKKVFYIPGTQDMDNVQTIAGLTILSRVAKLTAEYETKLEVPVSRSLVMVTAREIVRESYLNAGRPDFYNDDMVYYLTDDQFGYAAGIDGLVVRQRPATIFYQGAFYAESLILAETGNSIGAIQIAGTAMPAQLPFFVAACDYTLIGEELFAASAYLSREPKLLGSLKGQDIGGKLVFLSLSLVFIIIVTIAVFTHPQLLDEVSRIFTVH